MPAPMFKAALGGLVALSMVTPAVAQKTKAQLTTEVSTTFPDNIVGAITPLGVRTFQNDFINSIMPTAPVTSGNLACFNGTTGLLKDCAFAPNSLVIGTTTIASGTSKGVLYNSAGALANTISAPGAVLVTDTSSNPTLSANPGLGVPGSTVGSISLANATSGTVTVQPATGALGSAVASLPAGTYSVVGDGITQTLTNKTISGASNTLTVRLASDVTGILPFTNLPTGTQDTALGYWGSTTASALSVPNCTGALTYSTSTHTIGCNATTAGNVSNTGTPTNGQIAQWTNATTVQGVGFGTLLATSASASTTGSNPTGTASTTGVMMGMGAVCTITPTTSGRMRFSIDAVVQNNNATITTTMNGRYGTGAAPANGTALSGTVFSPKPAVFVTAAGSQAASIHTEGLVGSLSVGTAYWFDVSLATSNSGTTSSVTNVSCIAQEF